MPDFEASELHDEVKLRCLNSRETRLSRDLRSAIDRIWNDEVESRRGMLHNGEIFVLRECRPKEILGEFVEYKQYLAQLRNPSLREGLGPLMPLAVSGIIEWDGALLFGKRTATVTSYPGHWELVPSGGISADRLGPDRSVDFKGQILAELEEELGIRPEAVSTIRPFALIRDERQGYYDICLEIGLRASAAWTDSAFLPNDEYSEILSVPKSRLAEMVVTHGVNIVPTTMAILKARGLL